MGIFKGYEFPLLVKPTSWSRNWPKIAKAYVTPKRLSERAPLTCETSEHNYLGFGPDTG